MCYSRQLESNRCIVEGVADGAQAVEAVVKAGFDAYDCILMDCEMVRFALSLYSYILVLITSTASNVWIGRYARDPTPRGAANHSPSMHYCTYRKRKTGANRTLPHGGYGRCYGARKIHVRRPQTGDNMPFRRNPTSSRNCWNECVAPLLARHLPPHNLRLSLHCSFSS